MDLSALRTELTTDPLRRGYAAMSDAAAAADLNAANRTVQTPHPMAIAEMLPLVSDAGFAAVFDHPRYTDFAASVRQQDRESVGQWVGAFYKRTLITAEDAAALMAYLTSTDEATVSRAAELGLPEIGGGAVASARKGGV